MFSFKELIEQSEKTGCTCWTGYKRVPGTKPCESGSCMKEERGLWDNIHAKQERIKNGSGEKMRKPGSKGAPTAAALKASQNEEVEVKEATNFNALMAHIKKKQDQAKREKRMEAGKTQGNSAGSWGKLTPQVLARIERSKKLSRNEELSADEQFDLIEQMVMAIAERNNLDAEMIWEKFETIDDVELLEYAVDAKGHKSSTGGLTQKGRDAYNSKGANLQAPVTTPPSKLAPGSKAANRRKSFCARMGGMEGPMKKPNGEPSRKALALRKWNC
jgi:hypothetical protein